MKRGIANSIIISPEKGPGEGRLLSKKRLAEVCGVPHPNVLQLVHGSSPRQARQGEGPIRSGERTLDRDRSNRLALRVN